MQYYGEIYDERWYRRTGDEESYALNPYYQEIIKLHNMLVEHDIPHVIRRVMDGWQVCYPTADDWIADAVEHRGSYGRANDKLEIMGLLTPEEAKCDEVLGDLTAEEVFDRINAHWTKTNYNPVEVAYKLLVAYRDSNMIPDMGTVEELIGYLGEALA